MSRRATVARVLAIERGNRLLDVHMESSRYRNRDEVRNEEVYTEVSGPLSMWLWLVAA